MEINNSVQIRPVAVTAKSTSDTEIVKGTPSEEVTPSQDLNETTVASSRELQQGEIESVVENLNSFAQSIRRDLAFSLQNETGKVIVEVTDSSTGELIRKIPSEEALRLSERIAEVRSLMTSVKA